MGERVGVLGGTFDPIHFGHLVAASEVSAVLELDRVLFVPTGKPWQKQKQPVSRPRDRFVMTVLATASDPRFDVSRVDIERAGPTYTVDTLRDLKEELGDETELYFITGSDTLRDIATWRDVNQVVSLATFVGVTRPGHPLVDPEIGESPVTMVEIPALNISSTQCRERVKAGRPLSYLVPKPVISYIEKRGLYR